MISVMSIIRIEAASIIDAAEPLIVLRIMSIFPDVISKMRV